MWKTFNATYLFKLRPIKYYTKTRVKLINILLCYRPDDQVVSEISHLLHKENASSDILLSVTSLIHTYCKLNPNCKENVGLIAAIVFIEQKIKENILIKENRDEVTKLKYSKIIQ